MDEFATILKYIWLGIVAFVGGMLGFIKKILPNARYEKLGCKLKSLIMSIATSMFVAYISYEAIYHITGSERLSIALAGLASFTGTDLLIVLQGRLMDMMKKL